ncbi:MAG: hypothetical protein NTV40_01635 [Solirubrobacterales bacterium]|nr:hypothetical protein [Solirubrobacterales bacterium]
MRFAAAITRLTCKGAVAGAIARLTVCGLARDQAAGDRRSISFTAERTRPNGTTTDCYRTENDAELRHADATTP